MADEQWGDDYMIDYSQPVEASSVRILIKLYFHI